MRHSIDQRDLINPFGVRVYFERVIDFSHHTSKRSGLLVRHFRVIEEVPLRLDEQCAQRTQLPRRVTDHPIVIFVDVTARRSRFSSVMFAADETGFGFQYMSLNI